MNRKHKLHIGKAPYLIDDLDEAIRTRSLFDDDALRLHRNLRGQCTKAKRRTLLSFLLFLLLLAAGGGLLYAYYSGIAALSFMESFPAVVLLIPAFVLTALLTFILLELMILAHCRDLERDLRKYYSHLSFDQ